MKKLILISYLLLAAITVYAQQSNFPKLSGPYLGQKPPGMTPVIFAMNIIPATKYHTSPSFSPDGMEAFWKMQGTILISMMKVVNGCWTRPEMISLSSELDDFRDPSLSPDGKKLYFLSKGKLPYQEEATENIWAVDRMENAWSKPYPLEKCINSHEIHWQVSVAANGNLYFTSRNSGVEDIYFSEYRNGTYHSPKSLGKGINTQDMCETTPFIAPDESYIIFSRWSLKDETGFSQAYISFRSKSGRWEPARKIEGIGYCLCPRITPDGKYFFFMGNENGENVIKWVSAKIIDELRPKV